RDLPFAFVGTGPDGLALGARQLPGRFGEPSRTGDLLASDAAFADGMAGDPTVALPGTKVLAQTSSPIFAGQLQREEDDSLLELPLFPELNLDRQGDARSSDSSSADSAEGVPEFMSVELSPLND